MTDPNLLEIGRLGRAHGIRGEMFVSLTSDRVERVAEGSTLEAEGLWLTVVSSRPSSGRFIVRFAEIESRNDAEQMTGKVLRAHPLEDPEALWVHEMIGALVVDVDGMEWEGAWLLSRTRHQTSSNLKAAHLFHRCLLSSQTQRTS